MECNFYYSRWEKNDSIFFKLVEKKNSWLFHFHLLGKTTREVGSKTNSEWIIQDFIIPALWGCKYELRELTGDW